MQTGQTKATKGSDQDGATQSPPEKTSDQKRPLEERTHVFEARHWVNEACGDDLWDV